MISEYIELKEIKDDVPKNQKTKRYEIINIENSSQIGQIKWYGAFRCFCFYPSQDTLFSSSCLDDISRWCRKLTAMQKTIKCDHYE